MRCGGRCVSSTDPSRCGVTARFVIDWMRGVNRTSTAPHLARLQYQIAQCFSHVVIEEGNRRRVRPLTTAQRGRAIVESVYVPRSKNHAADRLTAHALHLR